MKLTRVIRIIPLIGLAILSACNDVPTEVDAVAGEPGFDNGGSYGSGGRASADSTSPTSANAPSGNGGSYGSGG